MARAAHPMALAWTLTASAALHAAVLVQFRQGGRGASGLWTSEGSAAQRGSENPGAEGPDTGETSEAAEALIPIEVHEQPDNEQLGSTQASGEAVDSPGPIGPDLTTRGPSSTARPAEIGRGRRGRSLPPSVVSAGATAAGRDGPGGMGAGSPGDPLGNRTGGDDALGVGATGVRGMTLPLLRVLPLALSADPSWSTLPLGQVGSFDLAFAMGEGGRVRLATPVPAGGLAGPQVRALIDQMLRLLTWPRFAVRASEMVEGVEKVRITIAIAQDQASAEVLAASGGAYGLGADPPQGRRPGKAHCTWANGRRVNVTLVSAHDF